MRNKTLTAIFALFLGIFGIHRFYLGQVGLGILYLVFSWTSIPFWLGIIDALVFFGMSEEEFDIRYNSVKNKGGQYYRSYSPGERHHQGRDQYNRTIPADQYKNETPEDRRRRTTINTPPRPAGKTRRSGARKPSNAEYKREGIKYFKAFNYAQAIENFEKAIEVDPGDIAVHFNLGCAYSLTEQKEKSFFHIYKAVELGFDDFEKIHTHESLAFMRIQPEYLSFKKAEFKTLPEFTSNTPDNKKADETVTPQHVPPPLLDTTKENNLLEEIKRLENLKELGVLNEEEFEEQKARLDNLR